MAPATVKRETENKSSAQHAKAKPVAMKLEDSNGAGTSTEVICIDSDSEDEAAFLAPQKRRRVILDSDSEDDSPAAVPRRSKLPSTEPSGAQDEPPAVPQRKRTTRPLKRAKTGTICFVVCCSYYFLAFALHPTFGQFQGVGSLGCIRYRGCSELKLYIDVDAEPCKAAAPSKLAVLAAKKRVEAAEELLQEAVRDLDAAHEGLDTPATNEVRGTPSMENGWCLRNRQFSAHVRVTGRWSMHLSGCLHFCLWTSCFCSHPMISHLH
jgi:hypothetical protein